MLFKIQHFLLFPTVNVTYGNGHLFSARNDRNVNQLSFKCKINKKKKKLLSLKLRMMEE